MRTTLSAGIIIRQALLDSPEVTAITGRVFPVAADTAMLPYIFYRRASLDTAAVKGGGTDCATIEVSCCAASYDESLGLAEAARSALDNSRGEAEGMIMRSCRLVDSDEEWGDDAYIQHLIFSVRV